MPPKFLCRTNWREGLFACPPTCRYGEGRSGPVAVPVSRFRLRRTKKRRCRRTPPLARFSTTHRRVPSPPVVFGEQVASKDGREWLSAVRTDLGVSGICLRGRRFVGSGRRRTAYPPKDFSGWLGMGGGRRKLCLRSKGGGWNAQSRNSSLARKVMEN